MKAHFIMRIGICSIVYLVFAATGLFANEGSLVSSAAEMRSYWNHITKDGATNVQADGTQIRDRLENWSRNPVRGADIAGYMVCRLLKEVGAGHQDTTVKQYTSRLPVSMLPEEVVLLMVGTSIHSVISDCA